MMAGESEPPLPMEIRLKSLYTPEDVIICTFINNHISNCSSLQPPTDYTHNHTHQCNKAVCCYFRWFSVHRDVCKKEPCSSCEKFRRWMILHAKDCVQSCNLELCKKRKIQQLRDRLKPRDSRFMAQHVAMTPNPTSNRTLIDAHQNDPSFNRSFSQPSRYSPSPSPEPEVHHHTYNQQVETSWLNGHQTKGHGLRSHGHSHRIEHDWSTINDSPPPPPAVMPNEIPNVEALPSSAPGNYSKQPIQREPSVSSIYGETYRSGLSHHGRPSRTSMDQRFMSDFKRNMSLKGSISGPSQNGDIIYQPEDETGQGRAYMLEVIRQNVHEEDICSGDDERFDQDPEYSLLPGVTTNREESQPTKYPLERQDTNPPEQNKLTLSKQSITLSHLEEIKRYSNIIQSKYSSSSGLDSSSKKTVGASESSDYYSSTPRSSVPSGEQSPYMSDVSLEDEKEVLGYEGAASILYHDPVDVTSNITTATDDNMELEDTSEGTVISPSEYSSHPFNRGDSINTVYNPNSSVSSPSTIKSLDSNKTSLTGSAGLTGLTGFPGLCDTSKTLNTPPTCHTHSPSHGVNGHINPYAYSWDRHQSSSSISETSSYHDDTSMESSTHYHSTLSSSSSSRPSHLEFRSMTSSEVREICERVDSQRRLYWKDIQRMNNQGQLMEQQVPMQGFDPSDGIMDCSYQYEFDLDCDFCTRETREALRVSRDPKREEFYYNVMMQTKFTENERQIRRQLDQQSDFREYLINQFYNNRVYREGEHWRRKERLGTGGQGACFSIHDYETSLILALKEAKENKKALKEAYVCLKLAHLSNASQNVLEYFSAALLPSDYLPGDNSRIQIFMEIMPTCFQSFLCTNGPMPLDHIHHYGYQLFDALDYLHSHGIIHCDVKPANILVNESAQRLKLADFGTASLTADIGSNEQKDLGTLSYNPPEYYSRSECGFAMDIWQAGCCVLAMATGRRPWRHLFMDVLKGRQSAELTNEIKRRQRDLISRQTSGHFYPTFLDEPLQKLLYGCLHANKASRPSAQDCAYMLVHAGATNEEQRAKVSQALEFYRGEPQVLRDFKMADSFVDVYLDSKFEDVVIDGACHGMMPGWLGCVEYYQGMTYRQLRDSILPDQLPVVQHFPSYCIAVSNCTPQEHFKNANSRARRMNLTTLYQTVSLDSPVDPRKSLVICKSSVQRTLC